jgi:EAL domain-containing protein (putative c-di-GMP-specific phosphodiesterase class I)
VNVTASSLGDGRFADVVQQVLAETSLPARALVVEVTETSAMKDVAAGIRTLTALRALGVRIAIDDFGTGWSSLSYLKRLPADVLKLDRSFVARLHEDEGDLAIAAAIIQLGQATGLSVVAEGVETRAQLAVLRQLRCAAGQGYLWSRGVSPSELAAALQQARQLPVGPAA